MEKTKKLFQSEHSRRATVFGFIWFVFWYLIRVNLTLLQITKQSYVDLKLFYLPFPIKILQI